MSNAEGAIKAPEKISGARKAAILCMTMGPEKSAQIFQHLSEDEVEAVTYEIASLQHVQGDAASAVLNEYRDVSKGLPAGGGGVDFARNVLKGALGDRANEIMKRVQGQMLDKGMKRFKKAPAELLHSVLRGEHPQTIALILSHLLPDQAATVVESMETGVASEVLIRVARMEKVAPDILQVVETVLSNKTDLSLVDQLTQAGGPQSVAQLLNLASAAVETEMLSAIADQQPELAEEIKNLMFVFEDLRTLDSKSIQKVLREVDSRDLALALKAVSEETKAYILKNMSERAAGALLEEMEYMGAVRVKDVEEAQAKVITAVRRLEDAGEIFLSSGGGDDFIN